MDLFKISLFIFFFLVSYLTKITAKSLVIFSVILLSFSLYINAVSSQNFILQVSTLSNIMATGLITGLIFKNSRITNVRDNKIYIYYLAFLILQVLHLVYDCLTVNSLTAKSDLFTIINPTGIVTSFLFVFSFNSKTYLNYTDGNKFKSIIIVSSFVLFLIIFSVQLGFLKGNTSKLKEDLGGVGLSNISTNETALLSLCYLSFLVYYIKDHKNFNFLYLLGIAVNCYIIVVTRSRLGLLALIFILTGYFIIKLKKNPVVTLLVTMLIVVLCAPLIVIIADLIHKREVNDTVETGFSTFSDTLGFTLSGRTLVWEAYTTEFFKLIKDTPFYLFFGNGFKDLQLMFNRSFLSMIGFKMEKLNFFPLHSDLLLIFITSGIAGIFLWFKQVGSVVKAAFKYKQFIVCVFAWILVSFSTVDMLSYSPLSSFLIGLGIAHKQKAQVKQNGKS